MSSWWFNLRQWLTRHAAAPPSRRVSTSDVSPAKAAARFVIEASQAHEAGDFDRARALAFSVTAPRASAAAALEVAARAALRTRRHPGTWTENLPPPPLELEARLAAIDLYRKAVEHDPTRVPPRWEMSRLLDAASDERLSLLRELAGEHRTIAILLDLGDCHHVRGEHDAARQTYADALALQPSNVEPYRRLELLCERLGLPAEAKQWRRAASERPLPRHTWNALRKREGETPDSTATTATEGGPTPMWCAVANVVNQAPRGPGGELIREGTKHFKAGAKVYCFTAYLGDGGDTARVIGRARKSHRWITIAMPTKLLRNARAKLCYEPAVLKRIVEDDEGRCGSQEDAEDLAALINRLSVAPAES
jgi:tetratricopeptide (TPR) repeat protein